jgi:hypothetical protein
MFPTPQVTLAFTQLAHGLMQHLIVFDSAVTCNHAAFGDFRVHWGAQVLFNPRHHIRACCIATTLSFSLSN